MKYKSITSTLLLLFFPLLAFGESHGAKSAALDPNDFVGVSFWLATAMMLAATVFFFIERDRVKGKWKTSLTVAGLVTGVAFWHYLYMLSLIHI